MKLVRPGSWLLKLAFIFAAQNSRTRAHKERNPMDGTSTRPTCSAFACAHSTLRCKYERRLYTAIVFRRYRVLSLRQPDAYPRLRVGCFRCKGGGSYGNDMSFTLNPTTSRATFAKRPGRCLSSKQKKKTRNTYLERAKQRQPTVTKAGKNDDTVLTL